MQYYFLDRLLHKLQLYAPSNFCKKKDDHLVMKNWIRENMKKKENGAHVSRHWNSRNLTGKSQKRTPFLPCNYKVHANEHQK